MSGTTVFIVTVALIVGTAFFVIIEFALIGARRHRLEAEAVENRPARAALRSMNELTVMLAGAQLGITLCTFGLGAVTKPAVDYATSPVLLDLGIPEVVAKSSSFAFSLLFVTFLHLVVGEMAPKSWAIAHPEAAAKFVAPPARLYIWPLRPFLTSVNNLANALVRKAGVEPVERAAAGGRDADTIRHLVEYSSQVGVFQPELQSQISEVIELQTLTTEQITKHNPDPATVDADATVADVQRVARETGHLRILIKDVTGRVSTVVHVRDTIMSEPDEPIGEFTRPVLHVNADKPVYELLGQMREESVQLAVVDKGHTLYGVVSLSDVIARVLPALNEGVDQKAATAG